MTSAKPALQLHISVQQQDFSVADEYQRLSQNSSCGAVVTFCGLVRQLPQQQLVAMELEHYPGMTEQALTAIANDAALRWPLAAVTIIHRVGYLLPSQQIVFVGVSSAHRAAGFAAAEFIMDYLKNRAPLWKKEYLRAADGSTSAHWVEAKASDKQTLKRWE